jgi:hypothetical protein
MIPKKLICIENVGQDVGARKQINQIIDYLSDKEASKGEFENVCGGRHYHSFWRYSKKCMGCDKTLEECNPPQQEESRGEKPPCTESDPCGCHFGEVFHADGICACELANPQLKEESPKEDEWEVSLSKFYGAMFEAGDFDKLHDFIRTTREEARKEVLDGITRWVGETGNPLHDCEYGKCHTRMIELLDHLKELK